MQFEFSNINTQYNQADVIASITKENASAAKSNINSVYESSALNLDAAVLSISTKGSAKINAMLSKSIQLRANTANPNLTTEDRQEVSQELRKIHKEIEALRSKENKTTVEKKDTKKQSTEDVNLNSAEAEKMIEESKENILKHADESLKSQALNRETVLQLL